MIKLCISARLAILLTFSLKSLHKKEEFLWHFLRENETKLKKKILNKKEGKRAGSHHSLSHTQGTYLTPIL